jgi:hypothetical protein
MRLFPFRQASPLAAEFDCRQLPRTPKTLITCDNGYNRDTHKTKCSRLRIKSGSLVYDSSIYYVRFCLLLQLADSREYFLCNSKGPSTHYDRRTNRWSNDCSFVHDSMTVGPTVGPTGWSRPLSRRN